MLFLTNFLHWPNSAVQFNDETTTKYNVISNNKHGQNNNNNNNKINNKNNKINNTSTLKKCQLNFY